MKVKKPQSKRRSTKLEKGIQKKVAAHHRKQRKLAKKDVTWKSRKPKDPGIPNSFPFKQQLLEEIEQNRMREAEERQRKREEMRQNAINQGATEQDLQNLEAQQDVLDNSARLSALMGSVNAAAREYANENDDEDMAMDDDEQESDEEEEEENGEVSTAFEEIGRDRSRKAFDKHFKAVVDACDVLIYVLDARNPNGTRSQTVEEQVLAHPEKRLIFVLNKVDLIPEEALKGWLTYLQKYFPTVPLIGNSSAPNAQTYTHKALNRVVTTSKLLENLKQYAAKAALRRSVTAGVIGYPNVGKSSVINSLLGRLAGTHGQRAPCVVGAEAGVTTEARRVKIDNKLSIMDCPGIVFPSTNAKKNPVDEQARLILMNALPAKQMEDCRPAVTKLLKRIAKSPGQLDTFMKYYDIPAVVESDFDKFVTKVLIGVARKLGRIHRGGIPNLDGAAQAIIVDWRDGRISCWTEPPKDTPAASTNVEVVKQWSEEFDIDGILGNLMEQ